MAGRGLSWRAAVAGISLIGALGCASSAFAQAVPEWARDRTDRWYTAFNTGDTVAISELYAEDAVLFLEGQTFDGRPAIEAFHEGNFAKARFECVWTIRGFTTVDKLAAVWGDDNCIDTPKLGGAPLSWSGRWLMVYQLQPDGSRLIVRDSGEAALP